VVLSVSAASWRVHWQLNSTRTSVPSMVRLWNPKSPTHRMQFPISLPCIPRAWRSSSQDIPWAVLQHSSRSILREPMSLTDGREIIIPFHLRSRTAGPIWHYQPQIAFIEEEISAKWPPQLKTVLIPTILHNSIMILARQLMGVLLHWPEGPISPVLPQSAIPRTLWRLQSSIAWAARHLHLHFHSVSSK